MVTLEEAVTKSILGQCIALMIAMSPGTPSADPVQLKFAYFAPDTELTWVKVLKPFVDAVNNDGQGVVELQSYPNGALGKNVTQQTQIISDGIADLTFAIPGLTPGRFPDNGVLNLPLIFRDVREATLASTAMVSGGKLRGFEDYFVIGVFGTAPLSLHTRTPISNLDDLKGKKMRVSDQVTSKMLRAFGAAPVAMGPSEVAEALARGTVDGLATQFPALVDFGLSKVATNHYLAGLDSTELLVLMTRKKFNSLPKAAQEIIQRHSGEEPAKLWIDGITQSTDQIMKVFSTDPKHRIVYPTEADKQKLIAASRPIVNEWTAQDSRNPELLDSLLSEIKRLNSGK
jgi:TRAP-type transport system periplasmic protein